MIEQGETQGSGRVKDLQTGEDFHIDEFHRAAAGPPLMREVERREEQQRVLEALEAGWWVVVLGVREPVLKEGG